MKLTKEQIKEIRESEEPYKVLARKYNVFPNTIKYHKSKEFKTQLREYQKQRYRNLSEKRKKEIRERQRDYQREYHRNRYHSDENFRTKQIENSKRSKK